MFILEGSGDDYSYEDAIYEQGFQDGITYEEHLRMNGEQVPSGFDSLLGGEFLGAFIALYLVFLAFALLINLVSYIAYGMGMSGIAKREGYSKPWLSWIPIANLFMIPLLVERDVHAPLRGRFTKLFGFTYVGVLIVAGIFGFFAESLDALPAGVMVLAFALYFTLCMLPSVLLGYGFYFIVRRYSNNIGLNMVVAILTGGLSVPFQLLRYRKREPRVNKSVPQEGMG